MNMRDVCICHVIGCLLGWPCRSASRKYGGPFRGRCVVRQRLSASPVSPVRGTLRGWTDVHGRGVKPSIKPSKNRVSSKHSN